VVTDPNTTFILHLFSPAMRVAPLAHSNLCRSPRRVPPGRRLQAATRGPLSCSERPPPPLCPATPLRLSGGHVSCAAPLFWHYREPDAAADSCHIRDGESNCGRPDTLSTPHVQRANAGYPRLEQTTTLRRRSQSVKRYGGAA